MSKSSETKMKVTYDISMLGQGWGCGVKAGIFRMTKNVAKGLINSPDCELALAAPRFTQETKAYLKEDAQLASAPLSQPILSSLKDHCEQQVARYSAEIDSAMQPGTVFAAKALRQLYWSACTNLKSTETFDANCARRSQIYHANYYPAPEAVNQSRKTIKFLTVYDLIPVYFPNYFSGEEHFLPPALSKLSEDDWVVCISQSTKDDLCNYNAKLSPDRVFITYPAASENFYPCTDESQAERVRAKYGIRYPKYILSLGTLEPRKNIDLVVRGFAQLVKEAGIDDLGLVLVGGQGWKFEKILAEVDALAGLKNRVTITGWVQDEDLAPLYTGALAFVYPSVYEGFGLPPLEAMQCGTPVVTSNTSSLPEVVGDAGLLIAPADVDAMCEKLLSLYHDEALRAKISERSIVRSRRFSWKSCVQETLKAYKASLHNT